MPFVLVDIAGTSLTEEDRQLLAHPAVAGVILFSRNYREVAQLKALCREIKAERCDLLIVVDQEGGRVQRFVDGFTRLPSMSHWGQAYLTEPNKTKRALASMVQTMASELRAVDINCDLLPVLDIDHGVSSVIGERSLGRDKSIIVDLARLIIANLHQSQLPAVGKHFPGHGAVAADSHLALPVDERSHAAIFADLEPFASLIHELDAIMPAHVIYQNCDADWPATFSAYWLQSVLREQLGFTGVIISDDLTMAGAAKFGPYAKRAQLALEAGCDLLLICNQRAGVYEVLAQHGDYSNYKSNQRLKKFISKCG